MQSSGGRRPASRVISPWALLAISFGLAGCASLWEGLETGENFADAYGDAAGFCGFLQDCGNHGNSNRGGGQTGIGTSSGRSSAVSATSTAN